MAAQLARIDRALVAVLDAGRRHHHSITRTKVAKLLYLADLEAIKHGLKPFSGAQWRWLQHGPFDNNLLTAENGLVQAGVIERSRWSWTGGYGFDLALPRDLPVSDDVLPEPYLQILDAVVSEFGALNASSLKDMTYQTAPMLDAQEDGRGGILDLWLVRPVPNIEGATSRMKAFLAGLPATAADDDEGYDRDELRAEFTALSSGRRKATARLIGE